MTAKGWHEGRNQLWDTFPAQYISIGEVWDGGIKRWRRVAKGIVVAIVFGVLGLLTLVFLPLNLFSGILAFIFFAVSGIGIGQAQINISLFYHVDADGACLQWPDWSKMGGVDEDRLEELTGKSFNKLKGLV